MFSHNYANVKVIRRGRRLDVFDDVDDVDDVDVFDDVDNVVDVVDIANDTDDTDVTDVADVADGADAKDLRCGTSISNDSCCRIFFRSVDFSILSSVDVDFQIS